MKDQERWSPKFVECRFNLLHLHLSYLSSESPIARYEAMQTIAQDPVERQAFFSLLEEYFQRASPPPNTRRSPSPAMPTVAAPPKLPASRTPPPTNSLNVKLTEAALKNPGLTASALRAGGASPALSSTLSRFGASHAQVLAPHVASAASSTASGAYQNRAGIAGIASSVAGTGAPPVKKEKGRTPEGLVTSAASVGIPHWTLVARRRSPGH